MNTMIKSKRDPLVSVVTPLYNSEKYLSECIESVLRQTYQNWEYVIVNNCSTDQSFNIATSYAKKDRRIRIINNDEFLTSLQNQNNALRKISPDSKYCKVVHSDDWLFAECIEKMVEICEENPKVGIVSSYVLSDNEVFGAGIPFEKNVVPGSVPCRMWLLENKYLFGNASSLLIRSDLVRDHERFYEEPYLNCDHIICYELLQNCDFGFFHQILSYARFHEEQTSSFVKKCNAKTLDKLVLLLKFGDVYLTKEENEACLNETIRKYYRSNGEHILTVMKTECWEYHRECLEKLDYKIDMTKVAIGVFRSIASLILNPGKLIRLAKKRRQ